MGTKFRTMLAPIGPSTGDGRRFAADAITLADTPFPFEWARSREDGHGGAVVVGVTQEAAIATVKDAVDGGWISTGAAKGLDAGMMAVWGRGEMFDDADREEMPRLAEDVAEAMTLISAGTLGPSVDLDTFEGVPVLEGTDTPVTWEDIEEAFEQTGQEPKLELLITTGRVRAATLVSIPAFAETSRPMELLMDDEDPMGPTDDDPEHVSKMSAMVASVAAPTLPSVAAFSVELDRPTEITIDFDKGIVFGHIATWDTCHLGYADMCVTAPHDDSGGAYPWFNRHPMETDGGPVWAGRLTAGGGHPGLSLTASATMAAYDNKRTVAHVRAYEDQFGIVVAGVLAPDLDADARAILSRRRVSGDWRETTHGLSLVEVLALPPGPRHVSEPGFPVATHSVSGRQVSLTAALGPRPGATPTVKTVDVTEAVRAELARRDSLAALRAVVDADRSVTAADARSALVVALGTSDGGA